MNAAPRETAKRESGEVRAIIARPWTAVPEHILEDRRLSLQARCMLAYMLGLARRPNWVIRLDNHVLPTMGVTRDRWRSIRKELETVGYYRRSVIRGPDGRMAHEHIITDDPTAPGWASPNGGPTTMDFSNGGSSNGGSSNGGSSNGGSSNGGRANRGTAARGGTNGGQAGSGSANGGKPTPLRRNTARSSSERRNNNSNEKLSELGAAGAAPNPQAPSAGVTGLGATPPAVPTAAPGTAPPVPLPPPASPARTPESRGTRLPDGWAPDSDLLEWAAAKRPEVDPNLETEKFVNYWVAMPGAKGRKLDWVATWRNWILGARATPGYAPALPEAAPPSKTLQSLESLDAFSTAYGHTDHAGPDQELQLIFPTGVG